MHKNHISTSSIQKLGHPIKEIRERALLSLISKVKYGFAFDEELNGLKKLLVYLLKWFEYDDSAYQEEVLEALFFIFKSSSGHSLIKLIGSSNMISNLLNIKRKINFKYHELLDNMIYYIKTFENIPLKECLSIPSLNMPSSIRSENIDSHIDANSLFDNSKLTQKIDAKHWNQSSCRDVLDLPSQGVMIYLMPWIHLCESDIQKILLNEECIRTSNSFERASYFFIYVLLKDFPADVFLNRPTTIKTFQNMINRPKFNILAIEALSAFCDGINIRIRQLQDPSLRHHKKLPSNFYKSDEHFEHEKHGVELLNETSNSFCDPAVALNQLPLPIFCLETMYIIVNFLSQTLSESVIEQELYSLMGEINIIMSLCEKLLKILFSTIKSTLWKVDKDNRFVQEILQKQIQLLRSCGDLLQRLRIFDSANDEKYTFHKILYIRMLMFCISFAQWSDFSPVFPQTFVSSLYSCIDDISFALIYPEIHNKLLRYLEFQPHNNLDDQNRLKIYIEMKKIAESMNFAIEILKCLDKENKSPDVISTLKMSIPSLEFHKNINVITFALEIFCLKSPKWKLSHQQQHDIKNITLMLVSHCCEWVKSAFYAHLHKVVKHVLGGLIKTSIDTNFYDESSLKFFLDPTILLEICCFGLETKSEQSRNHVCSIIQYLLKGKLLMSDTTWRMFLEAVLPSYPILNMHAVHDDDFGKSIIKTLNPKIGQCMLIPKIELVKGNIRLLYSKCFSAQMEGANNLLEFLHSEEDNNVMLPKNEFIRPDILCSALRTVKPKNFNVNKQQDPNFYEDGALLQIVNLLKSDFKNSTNSIADSPSQVDPSFCRSALSQLAIILQQTNLHQNFIDKDGCDIVNYYLRMSLLSSEFSTFPESAMSCVLILNSLLYSNTEIRHRLAEDISVLFNIIRAILLFPNEDNFVVSASQVLSLLVFSNFIINSHESDSSNPHHTNMSIHNSIAKKTNLPFEHFIHSRTSSYTLENKESFIMVRQNASSYLRIHWSIVYFGGLNKVLNWPYVPENSYEDEFDSRLMITNSDLSILKEMSPVQGCVSALYQIQNANSHKIVINGISKLEGYVSLTLNCKMNTLYYDSLPWNDTLHRFISAPPASPKDLSLLLCFMDFIPLYLRLFQNGSSLQDISNVAWIVESLLEAPYGICALLKKDDDEDWTENCDLFSYKLKAKILKLICECCSQSNSEMLEKVSSSIDGKMSWKNVIYYLNECLSNLEINNMNSLAYTAQILECLNNLIHSPYNGLENDKNQNDQKKLIYNLINLSKRFSTNYEYHCYKGYSLIVNVLMILSRFIYLFKKDLKDVLFDFDENCRNILPVFLTWLKSGHFMLKCISFKALSGIVLSDLASCVEQECIKTGNNAIEMSIITLADLTETSILREQAAILLCNILAIKSKRKVKGSTNNDELLYLLSLDFLDKLSATLTEVCLTEEDPIDSFGDNIPLDILLSKEKYEVAVSKKCLNKIPIKVTAMSMPKCTINLLIQISNVIHNSLNVLNHVPENLINSNVLKILFKCISLKISSHKTKYLLCTSICRTLYVATIISNEVLNELVNIKDCMNALLELILDDFPDMTLQKYHKEMLRWSLLLIGSFLETFQGYKCISEILSKRSVILFLHNLLLTINDIKYKDIIPSSSYCLVNFVNSYVSYNQNVNLNLEDIFDNTTVHKKIEMESKNCEYLPNKIIFNEKLKISVRESNSNRKGYDGNLNIEVLGEEFCHHLLKLYQDCNIDSIDNRVNAENFDSIATALCVVLGVSNAAKVFAVNSKFAENLISNLNKIQYYLMTHTKPQSISRNRKKSPIMHYMNWTILLLCNVISNCPAGKDVCAENNLIIPINKLWPWLISDEMTRCHIVQMLSSYTNSCPKSSHSMCMTVGTHSLLSEIIDLLVKEMNSVSQTRSLMVLEGCLEILKNVSNHIHCRTIIVKSEVFNCLNKLHPAITKRKVQWKRVEFMWENFCLTMSMYPEGQLKIGEYLSVLCAFVHQADGLMLLVLRNCTFNSANRPKYLASAEILQMFSSILSGQRSLADKIDVCIAIWALSANNHKSKLSLKTVGITSRLAECLHRIKSSSDSAENDFEIQIMTYVLEIMNVK